MKSWEHRDDWDTADWSRLIDDQNVIAAQFGYSWDDPHAKRLELLRAVCAACDGDADVCRAGTECPHDRICLDDDCPGHQRLPGCIAWTPDGQIARAAQPWELGAAA